MLTGGHVVLQARARILSLAACVGMAAGLLPSPGPAVAAFPGRNGRIAFSATQQGVAGPGGQRVGVNLDLFAVSPSGQGLRRVTESPESDDVGPAWSPDGRQIAFARRDLIASPTYARDIYVIDPRGGQVTNLTASPLQDDFAATWSPDGTKIVFASSPFPRIVSFGNSLDESDLYIMDSDGGNVVRLTDDPGREFSPVWSPQGDVIAYIGGNDIRLIRPDGSDSRVVMHFSMAFGLSWSPDGRRLTFSGSSDIWVINRDGSGPKNLTAMNAGDEFSPSWSPDGRWIAFVSNHEGKDEGAYKLFKMRPDGSDVTKIVDITLEATSTSRIDWGPRP